MPIDRSNEHKTNVRLPKPTSERLDQLSDLIKVSKNDLIAEACKLLCDLAESDSGKMLIPFSANTARLERRRLKYGDHFHMDIDVIQRCDDPQVERAAEDPPDLPRRASGE